MGTHAEGTFQLTGFDESTVEEYDGGAKLTRARIGQDLSGGGIAGSATFDLHMYYRPDGTATILGLGRIVGRIGDRSGSATVESTGTYDGTVARSDWTVVPGSGTGGLRGLTGSGSSAAGHGSTGTFSLDYDLD